MQANDGSDSYESDKAHVKIATLRAAALLALRNVNQVASHTFHVYLWDLIPGARENTSHVFTQAKEGRNQYSVEAKQAEANGLQLRPHSAKETPKKKTSPKEKEKESLARARVIAKAKDRKERTLVA